MDMARQETKFSLLTFRFLKMTLFVKGKTSVITLLMSRLLNMLLNIQMLSKIVCQKTLLTFSLVFCR